MKLLRSIFIILLVVSFAYAYQAATGNVAGIEGRDTSGMKVVLSTGTTAYNLVQLDATAKLPVLDGSQLTDITVAAGDVTGLGTVAILDTGVDIGDIPIYEDDGSGNASLPIGEVIDASGFNGNLTTSDDTVQEIGQALDDLTTGGGSSLFVVTPPTYSDESCTAGSYSLSEAYHFDCVASGNWNRTGMTNWVNPTPTAPTLTSATIPTTGATVSLLASEAITIGSGGNAGWDMDCTTGGNDITMTYSSGDTTSTLIYTLGSTITISDVCNVDYVQPGDGWENSGGIDMATIASHSVTNNSTQSGGILMGDDTDHGNDYIMNLDELFVQFETASSTGTATEVHWLSSTGAGDTCIAGLYDASENLMEETAEIILINGENVAYLTDGDTIISGLDYGLAVSCGGGTAHRMDTDNTSYTIERDATFTYGTPLPDPLTGTNGTSIGVMTLWLE